jgi:hypothetical protein
MDFFSFQGDGRACLKLTGLLVCEDFCVYRSNLVRHLAELNKRRVRGFRIPSRHQVPNVESPVLNKIASPDGNRCSRGVFCQDGLRPDDCALNDWCGNGRIAGKGLLELRKIGNCDFELRHWLENVADAAAAFNHLLIERIESVLP